MTDEEVAGEDDTKTNEEVSSEEDSKRNEEYNVMKCSV